MGEPAADSTQVPAPTYQHSSLDWRDWWCSDDAQIYQFIGQDNIYFYCIAQTAMWEALGWDLTQSTVSACYHLLYMGKRPARPRRRLPRRQTTCSTTTPASRCARTGCRSACPKSR